MSQSYNDARIQLRIDQASTTASNHYHYRQHQARHAYAKATKGKSVGYCNALIDEAMAICGSPYYGVTHRKWSSHALEFLAYFAKE